MTQHTQESASRHSGTGQPGIDTPTRQSLFGFPGDYPVSPGAVDEAIKTLAALGYRVVPRVEGGWQLDRPGSTLRIYRHSASELVHFAARTA